jgi:hypothetical protein
MPCELLKPGNWQVTFCMGAYGGTSVKPSTLWSSDQHLLQVLYRQLDRRAFTASVQTTSVKRDSNGTLKVTGRKDELKSTQSGSQMLICLCLWFVMTWGRILPTLVMLWHWPWFAILMQCLPHPPLLPRCMACGVHCSLRTSCTTRTCGLMCDPQIIALVHCSTVTT